MKTYQFIIFLFFLCAIPTFCLAQEASKKVITLPSGETVWDLNGEWEADVVNYGARTFAGTITKSAK
jgi:hypothetical protein